MKDASRANKSTPLFPILNIPSEHMDTIHLRALEPEDLELLYSIDGNPALWSISAERQHYSRFALRRYLASEPSDPFSRGSLRLVIALPDGEGIGLIDLTHFSPMDARAELSIALLSDFRGMGYGAQAISALEQYAAQQLRIRMLYAMVGDLQITEPSHRLFLSTGYRKIARLPSWYNAEGQFVDVTIYQKIMND